MKFAVIKSGGKQYLVKEGDKLKLEKINAEKGGSFNFKDVLLAADGKHVKIGTPGLENVKVAAKVLGEGRRKKVIIFHYHSKTRYKKKAGHRQPFTEIEILSIK